jgi:hypothetical protein
VRYFFLLSFVVIFSCNPPKMDKESQGIVKKELESRRIIKATEGEILAAAQSMGNIIADTSQKALAGELMNALKAGGIGEAIKYCNIAAIPVVDSLANLYKAGVKRTSLNTRNPANDPTLIEKQILEAYEYSHDNNQPIGENVQELDKEHILFTKPIMIGNAMCLNCHGTPGKDIAPKDHDVLKELYPNDNATGYSMGELRGMWSIRLSKREIIKSL